MILYTTVFLPAPPDREKEFRRCLEGNLQHPALDRVVVALESRNAGELGFLAEFREHPKLEIVPIAGRPFYADFFAMANARSTGEVAIIANADILFPADSQLERAREIRANEFWTISRYEPTGDGGWELFKLAVSGSHDTWVFRTPIRPFDSRYHLGILGCDGIIAQRALEAGLLVSNPSLSIRSRHIHTSRTRNHTIGTSNRSYLQEPDFMRLGIRSYCAPPSTLEKRQVCTKNSLRYRFLQLFGPPLLKLYRSPRVQAALATR